jgi:hypothetical protein
MGAGLLQEFLGGGLRGWGRGHPKKKAENLMPG